MLKAPANKWLLAAAIIQRIRINSEKDMPINNPNQILEHSAMRPFQITAVVICVLLNALDGFDVLSIGFAAPGIAEEWNIDRAALGLVLSMELIGMALGAVTLGGIADRRGRRPAILACLAIMAGGMYAASVAGSLTALAIFRFATGLGIGGMLASINAMVAEYANTRYRSLAVTLMAGGYPIGAIVGGIFASRLLAEHDWRSVFLAGAAATAAFIPLVLWLLPESIAYLSRKRPADALPRINRILARMGHPPVAALPPLPREHPSGGIAQLFSPQLIRITGLLSAAYFCHIMAFYFILKWIPKIVVDMGYSTQVAGEVLVWANVGGACGSILLGLLTRILPVRSLVAGSMILGAAAIGFFGMQHALFNWLVFSAAAAGFFTTSAAVGIYPLLANHFPTEARATGTGFAISVGRGGAVLGPVAAGLLFQSGMGLQGVALIMGMSSLLGAIAIMLLPHAALRTNGSRLETA